MDVNEIETKIVARTNSAEASPMAEPGVKSAPQSWNLSFRFFRDEAEMQAISSALSKTGWNRKRAAELLRISYRGLLYKIRRHNIAPPVAQIGGGLDGTAQDGAERS
jgi:transcriptional regulator with GAF, ATPase, and Fis domain